MNDPHRYDLGCPQCALIAQRIAEELVIAAAEQTVRAAWAQRWLTPVEQHLHREPEEAS